VGGILLEKVTKSFPDGTQAVRDLDLTIEDGELMVVVGPSGSGKSTLLRIVAGLEDPSGGTIRIGGRVANDLSPGERNLAMVFQDYALYPHMTAYRNMAFALKARRLPRAEIDARVRRVAALLGIEGLLRRRPRELSGGERQRVALGRAIVRDPAAFLMDEPLSNLDAKLRVQMRAEIRRLHERLGTTFLYVTHDQVEAMTLGNRVALMREGELQQVDDPLSLYTRPANVFVAAFIGSPSMNLVLVPVVPTPEGPAVRVGPWTFPLPERRLAGREEVILGIRPEHFEDLAFAGAGRAVVGEVAVAEVEPLGAKVLLHVTVDALPVRALDAGRAGDGRTFEVGRPPATLTCSVDGRTAARPGGRVRLAADASRVALFDAQTGRAL
jgi:multiple sugar transport system ATP-binding protein